MTECDESDGAEEAHDADEDAPGTSAAALAEQTHIGAAQSVPRPAHSHPHEQTE